MLCCWIVFYSASGSQRIATSEDPVVICSDKISYQKLVAAIVKFKLRVCVGGSWCKYVPILSVAARDLFSIRGKICTTDTHCIYYNHRSKK